MTEKILFPRRSRSFAIHRPPRARVLSSVDPSRRHQNNFDLETRLHSCVPGDSHQPSADDHAPSRHASARAIPSDDGTRQSSGADDRRLVGEFAGTSLADFAQGLPSSIGPSAEHLPRSGAPQEARLDPVQIPAVVPMEAPVKHLTPSRPRTGLDTAMFGLVSTAMITLMHQGAGCPKPS